MPNTAVLQAKSPEYDRAKEVKEFDDPKMGVKGFVDTGKTVIPRFFIHPPENLSNQKNRSPSPKEIPIIDLTGVNSDGRQKIVEQIRHACHKWGFFQVTNHGIPTTVINDSISAVRSFHEQPTTWKAGFYSRDRSNGFCYCASFELSHSKVGSWRDSLRVRLGWNAVDPAEIPAICRDVIVAWDEHVTGLADTLMGLLSEGLGLATGLLKEMTCLEDRMLLGHYYPYCPQTELTLGLGSHSDPAVLTVLLQDQTGGLQVKHEGEWIDVKPLPGALVVNIGDMIQIISNDEYQSVEHRVLANGSREPRIAIAMFFTPSKRTESDHYGPLPELLSSEKPPLYQNFTLPRYTSNYFSRDIHGKSAIDNFRL